MGRANSGVILPRLSRRAEIALILAVALAVRLYAINRPYISVHWIKQLQIAPIAHNFYTGRTNILWPMNDYSADTPPYIEIEFQLVTWLTAQLWKIFGEREWCGRAVAIFFSLSGCALLFALMRRTMGYRAAAYGLLFYAFAPSSIYFGRVLMSEPAMLALSIAFIYFLYDFLDRPADWKYLAAFASAALAFLVKLPTLYMAIPALFLAIHRLGLRAFRRADLWVLALGSPLPAAAYYLHGHTNIGPHYFTVGVGFGGQMWFSLSQFLKPSNWSLMVNRLLKDHLTAVGLVLLIIGLFWRRPARAALFRWWLAAVALYVVVVWGGNVRQTYYQLPLLPAAAGLVGWGWALVSRLRPIRPGGNAALVLAFLVLAAWGAQPFYEEYTPILRAARHLDQLDPSRSQPVIIMPPGFGCLYYFHRPGWVGREAMGKPPEWIKRPEDVPGPLYIEDRIRRGARWAVYFKAPPRIAAPEIERYLRSHFAIAAETGDYIIFDLTRRTNASRQSSAERGM